MATVSNVDVTQRRAQLHTIARNYATEGLGGKNFDAIPYDDNVSLRAPLCPGGSAVPLVGKENLRTIWWAPLPDLVGDVKVLNSFVNEELTEATVEFHCDIVPLACTLRIVDRFRINDAGVITDQENFFDSAPLNKPTPTIHHMALSVSDFDRSLKFYTAILSWLGYEKAMEADGFAGFAKGELLLVLRQAAMEGEHMHGQAGIHHLAFAVEKREDVNRFYNEVLLKMDAVEIEDPPVACPEIMDGFYATFFYDPDGIKLEVTHTP